MYTSGGAVEFMPNPYNIVKLGTGLCHRQQNATASPSLRRNSSGMQLQAMQNCLGTTSHRSYNQRNWSQLDYALKNQLTLPTRQPNIDKRFRGGTMKLVATIASLLVWLGTSFAQSPTPIQHVVIIFQEDRTPDNLFQGLPNADIAKTGVNSHGQKITLG